MDLFRQTDYRGILHFWMENHPERGTRSHLARAIDCSPSWMTRVLKSEVQLTPDQALRICLYFHINEAETDYFLLLVDLERASSLEMKKRLQAKMKKLTETSRHFDRVVKTDSEISEENRVLYYSSWSYAALHVACMIEPASAEELSRRTQLRAENILIQLKELSAMGLVKNSSGRWSATSKNIHLPANHAMSKVGHSIWRNQTIQHLQSGFDQGLHYSAVHCLSRKDAEDLRNFLKKMILECRKTIEDSPSETLQVLCLDWYTLER